MSRERDKGNRFEREVIPSFVALDGVDPRFANLATASGRIGNAYHLEVDGVTQRFAIECKHRESFPEWIWKLLDHVPDWLGKHRVVVIKKNRHRPVCLISLEDLLALLEAQDGTRSDP